MNGTLLISATLDQPAFLEDLVEKLAYRRNDIGYSKAIVPKNWRAIEMSSAETFVSGTVDIKSQGEMINMPFITQFFFTCIKEKNGSYKLEWSSSLT
jgi:hypothetical protein